MNLSTQRVLVLLGIAALVAAAVWWVATHDRKVVLEQRTPKALLADPWAGSKQFLSSMGLETHETPNLEDILDRIGDRDVLILDLRGPDPDQAQLARLRYWVRDGGRLVVEAGYSDVFNRCILPEWGMLPDSSRTASESEACPENEGYGWKDAAPDEPLDDDEEDEGDDLLEGTSEGSIDSTVPATGSMTESAPLAEAVGGLYASVTDSDESVSSPLEDFAWSTVRIHMLDSSSVKDSLRKAVDSSSIPRYRVETFHSDSLSWSSSPPRKAFADPGGFVLVGSLRDGGIVVVGDYRPFQYGNLPDWDHASLLWRMAGPSSGAEGVWIARRARLEGWIPMLAGRMPLALCFAALALVLGMWAAATRFGPALVAPREEKTGIVDHAEGAGRWLWQFPGGRRKLLASMQESARRKQLRTHPELAGADPRTLGKALASEGLGEAAALEEAFTPADDTSPKHFLSIAKTLWSLRRNR